MAPLQKAVWALRIGLGLMYLYSGIDLLRDPESWEPFLPDWLYTALGEGAYTAAFLRVQGLVESAIGLVFLGWFFPRRLLQAVCALSAFEMVFILIFLGLDKITFRDIGLLGASLSLYWLCTATSGKQEVP